MTVACRDRLELASRRTRLAVTPAGDGVVATKRARMPVACRDRLEPGGLGCCFRGCYGRTDPFVSVLAGC